MTGHIISALSAFIISVIAGGGYAGIVALMAIESACIPLPSEVIMPFSGALTVATIAAQYGRPPFHLWWIAAAGALGCNVGSLIAYEIGHWGGRPLVEKYGSYVLLSRAELNTAERFFARHGGVTVLLSRMLPVIRTFIALPAGVARMPRGKFHLYTFIGSFPWCLGLAWVGMRLGEKWDTDPRLKVWFHRFDALIGGLLLLAIVVFVWSRWKHRIRRDNGSSATN
jgi:membrane protein DedA with SNARE-associated domain